MGALINAQSTTRVPLENIDVDNTLKNEKLINKYVACVKQTPGARCPKDAQELKDLMPAILTGTSTASRTTPPNAATVRPSRPKTPRRSSISCRTSAWPTGSSSNPCTASRPPPWRATKFTARAKQRKSNQQNQQKKNSIKAK